MTAQTAPIHEDAPQEGYYWRRPYKDGPRELVIIWQHRETGEMVCRVGPDANARMEPVLDVWLYCAKNKVTKAEAQAYRQEGRWPGDAPLPIPAHPGQGHNAPPSDDPFDQLSSELRAEAMRVKEWVEEPHEGKIAADMAANWLTELRKLEKRTEVAFDTEKAPALAESSRIDTKWRPLKALAAQIKKAMDDRYQTIARKEKKRLQDIADAKARAEAEAKRREWEAEQAKIATLAAQQNMPVEPEEMPLFPVVTEAPPVRVAFGGAQGSRVGLRKKPATAMIEDWPKVAAYYAGNPKVRAEIQRLADHDARDGREVPGAKIIPGE